MPANASHPRRHRSIRIVIASCGLGHITRGVESWAMDLAQSLFERGEDVVLCKGGGRAEASYERVIKCSQRNAAATARLLGWRLPGAWRLGFGSPYDVEQTTFAFNLICFLRKHQPDILHVQDPRVALLAQRAWKMGLIRTRAVLTHGTEEPDAFLAGIHYLQHLAPMQLESAKARGVWKPTWTAIPNFVDTRLFSPGRCDRLRDELGIPREALVVVTAAAIRKDHKRIDYLIDEFAGLLKKHPSLPAYLIVAGGRESDTDELVATGQSRLGDRVRFLVQTPRAMMPDVYRAADLFVLCSLREMMAIVIAEAEATGLPCLVHDDAVLRWVAGGGGEAIDMARAGALSDGLAALLADASKRKQMGESARRHCVSTFGREQVVDRLLRSYQEVFADGQNVGHIEYAAPVSAAS